MWKLQYYESGRWHDTTVSVSGFTFRSWHEAQHLAGAKELRSGLPHRVTKKETPST